MLQIPLTNVRGIFKNPVKHTGDFSIENTRGFMKKHIGMLGLFTNVGKNVRYLLIPLKPIGSSLKSHTNSRDIFENHVKSLKSLMPAL